MNKWLVVLAVLGLLLVAGCARKAPAPASQTDVPSTTAAVSEFDKDLNDVDSLNSELDSSELDSLDQDLASLDK